MQTPESGKIYSINEGNYVNFPVGVKKFIKYCQEKDEATKRPYTSRYIGSLVADFHRNMLKGGVFLYPQTSSHPTGKLRLLYECNPMAFIAEQSGGYAGAQLHQREHGDKAGSTPSAGAVIHGIEEYGTEGTGVSDILQ